MNPGIVAGDFVESYARRVAPKPQAGEWAVADPATFLNALREWSLQDLALSSAI
jgi:hypothetical protein